MLDDLNSLLHVSLQVEKFLGCSQPALLDDPFRWIGLIPPDDCGFVTMALVEGQGEDELSATGYRAITSTAKTTWFRDEAQVMRDDEGKPVFRSEL